MPLYGPPESQEYLELMRDFIAESKSGAKRIERLTLWSVVLTFVTAITAIASIIIAVL